MSASRASGSGLLQVVATPIGNLEDLTPRAAEALLAADLVLAEDTRRTRALLSHLGAKGDRLERFDMHATERDVERVIERLRAGERVALVTDAGTPVVSDPGTALVRAAVGAGITVVPIPGVSAVTAAVSVSGLVDGAFRFFGFLPKSGKERTRALAKIDETEEAVVLFESPERVARTLEDLAALAPEREAMIARELTKVHEELLRGTCAELARVAAERTWLGEITVVLGPRPARTVRIDEAEMDRRIDAALGAGERARDVAERLALGSGWSKRDVYQRIVERRGSTR